MSSGVWTKSDNGTILYKSLTAQYIEGALEVLKKSFYKYESGCRVIRVAEDEDAIEELNELSVCAAKDGVSVVAVEKETDRVCAVAFNKLQVPTNPGADSFFTNFAKGCKNPKSRRLIEFMDEADAGCDLFELCKVDCLLELMFLATLPEFQKKGVALTLCEVTTEIARRLLHGENVKRSIDGTELKMDPVPKLVAALFTSPKSQRLGRKAGWEYASSVNYEELFYEGRSFASVLEEGNRTAEIQFRRIQQSK